MNYEHFLHKLLYAVFLTFSIFVAYSVGKQATIDRVLFILDDAEKMYKDSVIVEDLRVDVSKLR